MLNQFSRTQLLYGKEAMLILKEKTVAIFGIGGVGGYVVEALARSGIGNFVLVDNDVVSLTNINRQIIATFESIGKDKVRVMKERILAINPEANIEIYKCFFLPNNSSDFDFSKYDYVVDAIDTVTAKIELIVKAQKEGTKIISCMGMGNKVDPSKIRVSDIYKTEMDPLAKVMRHELKKRGIKKLKVVYSLEKPLSPLKDLNDGVEENTGKRSVPGSTAFVPSTAGLFIASEIVRDLISNCNEDR